MKAPATAAAVIETERLLLRKLDFPDAEFILALLNQESFLRFIGDRGVRTLADAYEYIAKGPLYSYHRHGYGLYLTSLRSDGAPVGICGLVKRAGLDDVDVGFALMPQYCSRGYASEAAAAVLEYARRVFGMRRVVAITTAGNDASIAVLKKIGMRFEGMIRLPEHDDEMKLFAVAI
jgi:RimJ/RimL family protein N-acetyltransferase